MPIQWTGLDHFNAELLALVNPGTLSAIVKAGGLEIENQFKIYPANDRPSRAFVYGTAFKTDKQRRWFFWALRSGAIQVPYSRGQSPGSWNLQQSWSVVMLDPFTAQIGTDVPYAPLMMDAERQTKYAKAVGWRTVQQDMIAVEPTLKVKMEAALEKAVEAWR